MSSSGEGDDAHTSFACHVHAGQLHLHAEQLYELER